MMNHEQIPTLEDVLNEFVAEYDQPTAAALKTWATRYPQFRRELVEFAAAWAEQQALPPAPELSAEQEKSLVDRAMSHVLNVAFSRDEQAQGLEANDPPVTSLTGEARQAGFSAQELAKECGLDLALISKLNNRQIRPGSIPPRLISQLGTLLRRPAAIIAAFFASPPQISAGRAFLSRSKPQSKEQQSFADAVRASSLSATEKERWLEEAAGLEEET